MAPGKFPFPLAQVGMKHRGGKVQKFEDTMLSHTQKWFFLIQLFEVEYF